MICLSIRSQFGGEATQVTLLGEHEADICNIMVSRLQLLDYEVEIEDGDGEMVPFEEFEHD